jgi:cell division protein FtsB
VHPGAASRTPVPASTGRGWRPALTSRAAILGLVLCALVLALAYPLQEWLAQRAQIAHTTSATVASRESVNDLERTLNRWQNPGYVERQAREQLHLTFPGQQLYLVERVHRPGKGVPVARHGRATVVADPASAWYGRLWSSDVTAGG